MLANASWSTRPKPAAEREQALAALAAGTRAGVRSSGRPATLRATSRRPKPPSARPLADALLVARRAGIPRVAALRRIPSFGNPKSGEEDPPSLCRVLAQREARSRWRRSPSRPQWAQDLLAAIEKEAVPQHDVSAYTVRQLQALKNAEIETKLKSLWGSLRPPAEGKSQLLTEVQDLAHRRRPS